jgi:hypothetical protein
MRLSSAVLNAKIGVPTATKVAIKTTSRGTTGKVANPLAGFPRPLQGGPALAKAFKNAKPEAPSKGGGHSLFSLHTLESGANAAAGAVKSALDDTYGARGGKGGVTAPGAATALPVSSGRIEHAFAVAAKNTPGSLGRTITGAIPGAIDTGKALAEEALLNKPGGIQRIAKGVGQMIEHPVESFEHEPVPTLLMAAGGESGIGEAVGGAARAGTLGDAAAEAASTARPDLKLFNDESIPREYSKSVIRKGAQVAADKFREKILNDPDVNQATGTRLNRHIYGGGILGQRADRLLGNSALGTKFQGLVKPGLVDKAQGSFTDIRKMYSNAAAKVMHDIKGPLPKGAEEAVPLAVEGTVRRADTARADLEGRLSSLRTEAEQLTGREAKLNRAQQDQITKLLANKAFIKDPQPVIDAAKDFSDHQEPQVDRKVQVGQLEPDQVHAKYVPYATQHMGAEYNLDPGKHPLVSEITGLNRTAEKARQDVKTAQDQLENASAPSPRVRNDHPVALARQAVKDAELGKASIEGKLSGTPLRSLGREKGLADAKAAYAKAKADLVAEHTAKLSDARQRLADARGSLLKAKETLGYMKDNGVIKGNGDMYPRLELNGNPLLTEDIQAHARQALGNRDVGFLTHKDQPWSQAVHARSGVRPATEVRSRTGIAYKTGTYDSSWDALKRQAYKDAQDIAGHDSRDDMIRRFGFGSYKDQETAQRAADNFNHTPEGEELTKGLGPVQVVHAGPDRVLNRANMPSSVATDTMKDFGVAEHKAVAELGPEGKYRLMPKAVTDRIAQHDKLNQRGGAAHVMQALTNKFRSTTLYTNPRWPVGISQENSIRLAFAGINPFAQLKIGAAVKLGDDLADHFRTVMTDPAATEAQRFVAKAQVAAIDSGTQYGSLMNSAVRRPLDSQLPEGFQAFTDSLSEKAPASQVLRAWKGWKTVLGNGLHALSSNTRKAMLGKVALNETRKFSSEWKQLISRQDRATKAFAEGKLTPTASAKLGDDIMKMAGNWSQLTPAVRSMTQTVAPFSLWYLNSMKFIFKTLPVDHPFKSAALAAMAAATGATKNAHPTAEYLDGGIGFKLPIVGNITAEVSKYSPFGIGVEPEETALGIFGAPTISGPLQAAMGLNPFNQQPLTESYEPKIPLGTRLGRAGEALGQEMVPGLIPGEQLLKKGGKEEPRSLNPIATKPGTQKGLLPALVKEFSPVPFIAEPAAAGGRTREPRTATPLRERVLRTRALRER